MITIKGITYTIHTAAIGNSKMLIKNGEPVLCIPDELVEDFIQILTSAGVTERLLNSKPEDLLTDKNETNDKI